MNKEKAKRFLPLILTAVLVIIDQISKALIIKYVPENTLYKSFFNDFLWIFHVRNTGAAFSFGAGGSDIFRLILFVGLPIVLIGFLMYLILGNNELTKTQKWFVAGIAGGGIGTLIDRIVRFNTGVVDFISVNMYGLFGMNRWPTFNISDSCVVVFVILLIISFIVMEVKKAKKK